MLGIFMWWLGAGASGTTVLVDDASPLSMQEIIARVSAERPLNVERVRLEPDRSAANAAAQSAERECTEGKSLAFLLQLSPAIAALERGIALYDIAAVTLDDFTPVAACLIELGAAQTLMKRDEAAQRSFRQALVLRTRAVPDPKTANPDVTRAFERARDTLGRQVSGALVVTGSPHGAWVKIDGQRSGRVPISLTGVPAGPHWLVVSAPGFNDFATRAEIPSGTERRVEVFLGAISDEAQLLGGAHLGDAERRELESRIRRDKKIERLMVFQDDASSPYRASPERVIPVSSSLAASSSVSPGSSSASRSSVPIALAILPFGIGQFVEKRAWVGALFLTAQALLLAANITTGVLFYADRAPDGTFYHEDQARVLQIVNLSALGALVSVIVGGSIDGGIHRAPSQ
jgi:PEGA domain